MEIDFYGAFYQQTEQTQRTIALAQAAVLGVRIIDGDVLSAGTRAEMLAAIKRIARPASSATGAGKKKPHARPAAAFAAVAGSTGAPAAGPDWERIPMSTFTLVREPTRDSRGHRVDRDVFLFQVRAQTPEAAWDESKGLRDAWGAACPSGDARRAYLHFAQEQIRSGDSFAICPFIDGALAGAR